MSAWDSSALVKLYVQEPDSADYDQIAARTSTLVIAEIARFEAQTVFRRREAEGSLAPGDADVLTADLEDDIASGKVVMLPANTDVRREFKRVLDACFSQVPAVFVRTSDAIHVASALVRGEQEFVSADQRQRAVARLMGLSVLP